MVASLFAATILTGWSAGSTWLILSRDTFSAHLMRREVARQYVYEDRIASLKGEIDKLSSRQLVDQDGVEARVNELVTRQSQLETRQAIVTALAESINGAQIATGRPGRTVVTPQPAVSASTTGSVSSFAPSSRPLPVPEMPGLRRNEPRGGTNTAGWDQSLLGAQPGINERLAAVEGNLRAVQTAQARTLAGLETSVGAAQASLRAVIAEVGLDPDRAAAAARAGGQGGPFVPANLDPRTGPFEASVVRLQPKIAAVERLRGVVSALPLRRPMGPEAEQSSAFGHRLDPFTRGLAMHTGIDFRAEHGSPVRSTGAGTVVTAEYSGGYGNMVEIDHGNGVTTRYAHLSAMLVSEGQHVRHGTVIGRVGSTGRSTGPHLHYETRIEGDAVDPQRFLRAGNRFLAQN